MPRPIRDYRGRCARLPSRPGLLRRLAAPLYGRMADWTGERRARRPVATRLPVLSVGNLEVGGTGKTPAVAALAELLLSHGVRPAILTGMTGPAGGRRLLSAGDAEFERWAPDEARLLASRFPGLSLVAACRKWEGALHLDRAGAGDLILLDDGFQHRRLVRRLDLVILSEEAAAGGLRLLPAGPLRESVAALDRAHAFLVPAGASPKKLPERPRFSFRVRIEGIFTFEGQPAAPDGAGYISAAAIARPDRFEEAAANLCKIHECLRFEDHAPWRRGLRKRLAAARARWPQARFLLTEKDAARWRGAWDLAEKTPHVLRIRLEWQDPGALWNWLNRELERAGREEAASQF